VLPPTLEAVSDALRSSGADITAVGGTHLECRVLAARIPSLADRLAKGGVELQLLTSVDTRDVDGAFTLVYVFAPPTGRVTATVLVSVSPGAPSFPSIATRSFAASRFERDVHDLFGLVPTGHPDLRRLALHQFWPEGYHPLRRDVAPRADVRDDGQPFPFRRVEGEGIFEITVGPVHAGIIEPGHFRFSVEGETIINLETRLGFVHKGTEKLFETLPFERTWALAERVSGDTTVGHALAYCQALEALGDCAIPPRAACLRTILLELERLSNHVGDVGMIVNDTGFAFGHAHCFRLREELLRLNERFAGHRLLRGTVVPGGVAGPCSDADPAALATAVEAVMREFADVAAGSLENTMVHERLQGTGRLTPRTAREMQVVGLVARASGLDADVRRDAPFAAYGALDPRIPVLDGGDAWARTVLRIEEARESVRLLRAAAEEAGHGPTQRPLGPLRAGAHALGLVEAWRGPIWTWVAAAGPRLLRRVKIVDPSYRNWPALEYAVLNNIVPDFPLCNKSFNLSYSGNDL
jgi:Ni,Fe-hydrogenase III large subunit/Ni,Fe-hydrogenase III component G